MIWTLYPSLQPFILGDYSALFEKAVQYARQDAFSYWLVQSCVTSTVHVIWSCCTKVALCLLKFVLVHILNSYNCVHLFVSSFPDQQYGTETWIQSQDVAIAGAPICANHVETALKSLYTMHSDDLGAPKVHTCTPHDNHVTGLLSGRFLT